MVLAVVDDDPIYRDYVCALLEREGVRTLPASGGSELLELLDQNTADCIVLDYDLGAETGFSISEQIKSRVAEPPPIIMLTGGGGERTAVKAFRGGFSDYVSKRQLNPEELLTAIRVAVDRHTEQKTAVAERERLSRLSGYDAVTGLQARHRMDEILADVVTRASRRGATFALLVIRVFGFDGIKDQFGHVAGDRALRAFAGRLRASARPNDMFGHHDDNGGFIYILDQDPKSQTVVALCDELARALTFDLNIENARIRLRPTIGGSLFPADGPTAEQILQAALGAQGDAQTRGIPVALTASLQSHGKGADELDPVEDIAVASGFAGADNGAGERLVDRRSERRQRVLQRGQIRTAANDSAVDCTIRDLSGAGARLRVDGFFAVPDEFELYFTRSGSRRRARVCWQVGNDIGVQFVDTANQA